MPFGRGFPRSSEEQAYGEQLAVGPECSCPCGLANGTAGIIHCNSWHSNSNCTGPLSNSSYTVGGEGGGGDRGRRREDITIALIQ